MLAAPEDDWVFIGVVGRWDRALGNNYWAGISTDGRIGIGMSGGSVLAQKATVLDVLTQDVEMQFDIFGNRLHFTAWEAGMPQPETQISITDDSFLTGGYAALSYNPRSSNLQTVAYDYFEVVAIPEPSSVLMAGLGLLGLAVCRRKRPS